MAIRIYTFSDAQRLTGVARGHLARWAEQRVITADLGGGGVSGAHRKFSFRNIFEIAMAVELQRFRVPQDFIKHVLTSIRTLDPDTVMTADIPVNRPNSVLDGLTPKERTRHLAAWNRDFLARQKASGRPKELWLKWDPNAALDGLQERLESDEDNDAKRWNRFKRPETRGDMLAFVVLNLHNIPVMFPFVSFVSSLSDIEESARFRAGLIGTFGPDTAIGKAARDEIVTVLIDAGRVLMRLELETGDTL